MSMLAVAARWTSFLEKYVLSLLFLWIAYGKVGALTSTWQRIQAGQPFDMGSPELAATVLNALTLVYGLFFGFALLFNRRAVRDPSSWREILVPLLATFLLYAMAWLSPYAPGFATRSLLPDSARVTAMVLAIQVSLIGYAIGLWSVAYLGRSLSLVVSVRRLVWNGPYRYVRHPMYLGYIVIVLGIAIASSSVLGIALWLFYVMLTIYRARLEEAALTSFTGEYRDYVARTGFLLPRFGAGRSVP
jgi:protein-S-isoprenylcysteine O-methyltransferase Ste14